MSKMGQWYFELQEKHDNNDYKNYCDDDCIFCEEEEKNRETF
jgi:hypothetical protein